MDGRIAGGNHRGPALTSRGRAPVLAVALFLVTARLARGDLPGPGGLRGGLALALGGAAFALSLAPLAKGLRRRVRRSGRGGDQVAAAWREALERLAEAGLAPSRAETALEFAGRAEHARPGTGSALLPLAALLNGSVYAPRPPAAPRPVRRGAPSTG